MLSSKFNRARHIPQRALHTKRLQHPEKPEIHLTQQEDDRRADSFRLPPDPKHTPMEMLAISLRPFKH